MNRIAALLAFVVAIVAFSSAALAERRVALVIGNAAYKHAPALANPANDARAVAAALQRLNFEVTSGFDLGNADLRKTIREFAGKLGGADVALFFYAGHGLQVSGENFLIPVDAAIEIEADLDFHAVRMDLISRQMDRETKIKIVMLDACRDNPFEKQLARSMSKTRSAALRKGLAEINTVGGSIIAFATDPGDVALDGDGRHSPFTSALLRHIETPGVEIGVMLRRVTRDVFEATREKQRPWTNASLTGEFYLNPGPPSAAPPAVNADDRQIEIVLWQTADKSGLLTDYEEYLRQFPSGRFANVARNRVAALKSKTAAAAPSAPAPAPAPAANVAAVLSGRWVLRPVGRESGSPVGSQEYTSTGDRITTWGPQWRGHGTFDGQRGYYDWLFTNGKAGRTTIQLLRPGVLAGQVRGGGIDWDYIATRN